MTNENNSRVAAFFILKKVLDDGITLDAATEIIFEEFSVEILPQERRFIRHVTTTVIRRLGQLDKIINHCTKTKLGNTQMAIRHVLRIGIVQLLFSEVPAHAAVNTSVNLVQNKVSKKLQYLKNTVNAVLRNVDRERESLMKKYSNTRLNFPNWLLKGWDDRYGNAAVKEILNHLLVEAPLDISLKPELDLEEWANKLNGKVVPGGIRLTKAGKITELEGYFDGTWWVQDMGARLPANLLGAGKNDRVLDLCAAPGGKAAQSAAKGAKVTAVDLSRSRLGRLRMNMQRLKFDIDIIAMDILKYQPEQNFDYILLDAPCSSTGTIRRHPEILHMRSPADIKAMVDIQIKMLDHASTLLNKGGTLVYSVCSMEQAEGPDQIDNLLARNNTLRRQNIIKEELPGLEQTILPSGDVQTLPYHYQDGMDGFFISRLVKE
ncbi:MAG: methyltransferase [Kordiimonadaceae bacterium]|jgi:16S rRNA (cytosine967-C5)-methyltransferase|nr:methyltransferase [Kordiimonadaceae bacterium]MBT6032728.1 methyltransferase [Kordiimonadaceae bacterium]